MKSQTPEIIMVLGSYETIPNKGAERILPL